MAKTIFALSASLILGACAVPETVRQPTSTDNGILSACAFFRHEGWPDFFMHPASEIFWAQQNSRGRFDFDHPVASAFSQDGCAYAVDVPPGTYAPFFCSTSLFGLRLYYRFDAELLKETTVRLAPGGWSFSGRIGLNTGGEGALRAFKNLALRLKVLAPPFSEAGSPAPVDYSSVEKTPLDEATALRSARGILARTLWEGLIADRLAAIGNPPPPLFKGPFWERRPVNPVKAAGFYYVDTLEWGKPRAVMGGLEWREPKDRAAVAVQFFSPGDAGYRAPAAYLERLREAGIPSDAHVLFKVYVSTYAGQGALYTSYDYPRNDLPGSTARIFMTETWLVSKKPGYCLVHYRAKKRFFEEFYPAFRKFTDYLSLDSPGESAEIFQY